MQEEITNVLGRYDALIEKAGPMLENPNSIAAVAFGLQMIALEMSVLLQRVLKEKYTD